MKRFREINYCGVGICHIGTTMTPVSLFMVNKFPQMRIASVSMIAQALINVTDQEEPLFACHEYNASRVAVSASTAPSGILICEYLALTAEQNTHTSRKETVEILVHHLQTSKGFALFCEHELSRHVSRQGPQRLVSV